MQSQIPLSLPLQWWRLHRCRVHPQSRPVNIRKHEGKLSIRHLFLYSTDNLPGRGTVQQRRRLRWRSSQSLQRGGWSRTCNIKTLYTYVAQVQTGLNGTRTSWAWGSWHRRPGRGRGRRRRPTSCWSSRVWLAWQYLTKWWGILR